MRCPWCGKELELEEKICPNCNRLLLDNADIQPKAGRKPIRIIDNDSSDDSRYADVMKPHSSISVKGLGSKMSGPSKVTATRHRIASSDGFHSSIKIRCTKCGTVNDNSDQYCRKCGTRITS